jgi:SSS family solute:Na+ symporter
MPELLTTVVPPALAIVIFLPLPLGLDVDARRARAHLELHDHEGPLRGFVKRDASDRTLTLLVRGSSVFFILLSVALALKRPAVIVTILSVSWGAIGSVFLGPFLWGLFTKRIGAAGALAGALLGLATCLGLFALWDRRRCRRREAWA